jgi:uncharacterized protein
MIKKLLLFIVVAVSLACSMVGGKVEAQIPKPEGDIYVQDFAHVLSNDEKNELINLGVQLDKKTKAQIAVLTIPTLNGKNLAEYAVDAFRTYQLGDKKLNNGVLLLLVTGEKKIRIEVGYGLEGALPDGKVGRILDQYAIPYLKNGNQANKAIINTYKKLFNEVSNEYHLTNSSDAKAYTKGSSFSTWKTFAIGIGVVILIILDMRFFGGTFTYIIINIFSAFLRGGGGNGGNKGGGGGSSGGGGASRRW